MQKENSLAVVMKYNAYRWAALDCAVKRTYRILQHVNANRLLLTARNVTDCCLNSRAGKVNADS